MADYAKIFMAYDIRGIVPGELDEDVAEAVGAGLAKLTGAEAVVIVHDMRTSSGPLAAAMARGVTSTGADVVDGGLGSTDMLYYASGSLGLPGAMITASHNPARYNGIKLCWAGAKPIGQNTGLAELKQMAIERAGGLKGADARGQHGAKAASGTPRGSVRSQDLLSGYAEYLNKLVDLSSIRPLRVVVDAGNGMAGHTVPKVFAGLPIETVPLYFELDGSFPNHEANPLDPKNLVDLQAAVRKHSADIGLAFDGDADRCFVVDERGEVVSPSVLTALVAVRELAREPGATVIHNLISSKAVPQIVAEHGGTAVRTRVGHSFIKAVMAERGGIFGGEHSGHFYFRDFWFADSGMLAGLHVLAALGGQDGPLSELLAQYSRYVASGEINSEVADTAVTTAKVRRVYEDQPGITADELDGLTIASSHWWFNLRPSNTEPLLRLNVEADDAATLAKVTDDVLRIVRSSDKP